MIQRQLSQQNNFRWLSYASNPTCTSWQNLKETKAGKTSHTLSIMLLMFKSHSLGEEKGFFCPLLMRLNQSTDLMQPVSHH